MKKTAELIKITPSSYKSGDLKIGDSVVSLTTITSDNGNVINRGEKYKIKRLLNQDEYPGGFVINYHGSEWGFYVDNGAEWWGIVKEDKDEDEINIEYLIGGEGNIDIGISEFETIPYTIYKVLDKEHIITRKDLVEKVAQLENPHSLSRAKIRNSIESAINSLLNKGYLALMRHSSNILLTPPGKRFFEYKGSQEEVSEKTIDNEILIKELQKGKTIVVDDSEIIDILKKYPDIYFLIQNEKGTYDLGAVYSKFSKDWVISRKYRQSL